MLNRSVVLRRMALGAVLLSAAVVIVFAVLGMADQALAQGAPFGGPRPPAEAPVGGIVGWILARQGEFYRALSGLIRQAKADGTALWSLFGLSFVYGIFHAAGPGHGKAVISSYVVANEETWRRGVVLSFASSVLQAAVAVTFVTIAAVLLGVTAARMNDAVRVIEIVSYALIVVIGLRLIWVKGRGFLSAWRSQHETHPAHAQAHHHHDIAHAHQHGEHCHGHDHGHDHAHEHSHDHDDHHGHSHGPEPQELAGPGGWSRGLSAIVAVGLRPCSGAILVLVFALSQGLYWAGIASAFIMGLGTAITVAAIATFAVGAKAAAARIVKHHSSGAGALAVRGVEVLAAVAVCLFGVALLTGYMVSERLMGF